ncbi:hypothetical protein, partial [Tenacibaculum maritimum]
MKGFLTIILFGLSTFLYSQIEFEANNISVLNRTSGKLIIEKYYDKKLYKNQECNFTKGTPEQRFCDFFNLETKEELTNFFYPYKV